MDCANCADGCDACRGGQVYFDRCPLEIISWRDWNLMEYAELYKKGLPPLAGGALDQAACFVAACNYIYFEQQSWKRKLKIIDGE